MTDAKIKSGLARALALSQEMLAAAELANLQSLELLDAERLDLLKSFRLESKQVNAADRALLQQISQTNERTIGLLEHQRRSKGRDMDMAAVGRRAVAAYSNIRPQR
jgi:predicted MarR family transcription regulator